MSEVDTSELIPGEFFRRVVTEQGVRELVHADPVAEEGDYFVLDGQAFEITSRAEEPLEDAVPEDAHGDYEANGDTVFVYEFVERDGG